MCSAESTQAKCGSFNADVRSLSCIRLCDPVDCSLSEATAFVKLKSKQHVEPCVFTEYIHDLLRRHFS